MLRPKITSELTRRGAYASVLRKKLTGLCKFWHGSRRSTNTSNTQSHRKLKQVYEYTVLLKCNGDETISTTMHTSKTTQAMVGQTKHPTAGTTPSNDLSGPDRHPPTEINKPSIVPSGLPLSKINGNSCKKNIKC